MHEMSLAMSIIDIALAEAEKAGASTITEIEIEVGQLAGVLPEALEFCLEAAARGTKAEASTFSLLAVPGVGRCLSCQHEVTISEFPAQCPDCGGFGVQITGGTELKIRSISIDEDTPRRKQ